MFAAVVQIVRTAFVAVPKLEHGGREDDVGLADVSHVAPCVPDPVVSRNPLCKGVKVKAEEHSLAPCVANAKAAQNPLSAELCIPLPAESGRDQPIAITIDQLNAGTAF